MLVQCALLLLVSAKQHFCEDGSTEVQKEVGVPSEYGGLQPSTQAGFPNPSKITAATTVTNASASVDLSVPKASARSARRRGRRLRGYYNYDRFRNNAYNPYNPNSPYSFRGRPPPQPPIAQGGYYHTGYENPYYDAYKQGYYNYPGYTQPGYYNYPYQPQPPAPQPGQVPYPPTAPPTEAIPDLYYVRDSPDGYQYQKVSVAPDVSRPRPAVGQGQYQQYGQAPQGYQYYGYQYEPYRRPPPPAHQQSYYQPAQYGYPQDQQSTVYQQQMQYAQRYTYPRGRRARFMRTGRPTLRIPGTEHSWKLTIAPDSPFEHPSEKPPSSFPSEQVTE